MCECEEIYLALHKDHESLKLVLKNTNNLYEELEESYNKLSKSYNELANKHIEFM